MCFRIAYINKFGKNNKTIQNWFKAKIKKKRSLILENLPRRKIDNISEKYIQFLIRPFGSPCTIPHVFASVRYVSTFSRAFIQL